MKQEQILRPVGRVRGGVALPHLKRTAEMETVIMPPPEEVNIPLSMHIGAPCQATVAKGDHVFVGTVIGDVSAPVSAPIHASVSGEVTAVGERMINGRPVQCVTIQSDGKMESDPELKPFPVETAEDVAVAARACGLVGLGGAGFPTHIKLKPNGKTQIDTLVVNAAECEPYLTADYRECIEKTHDVVEGVYLLKDKLNLDQVILCVESNKPAAIRKLYSIAADYRDEEDRVRVMKLPSSYPQGAEKVIIYSATGRAVPAGKLPADVGCIVMNITSVSTLYRFITTGMPLTAKRVTVEGDACKEPKNILVPIGTSVRDLLAFAGEQESETARLIMGGPMMGNPIVSPDTVIEKRTNGLLLLKEAAEPKTTPCIRCGRCAAACPMALYPAKVETAYRMGHGEQYAALNVNTCMECGSCSYVCPAKRPLTQVMRVAKAEVRRMKK